MEKREKPLRFLDFAAVGTYLWSGWGAVCSIALFFALWAAAAEHLGSLILPGPKESITQLGVLLNDSENIRQIGITARRAIIGFLLAATSGSILGIAVGLSVSAVLLARPIITLLIGIPPIAWLVLALLWFGMNDGTPIFTVLIASFPAIFLGALQGARTLEGELKALIHVFKLPPLMRLTDLYFPHVVAYLFPAWISALGASWKIVVMAELLACDDGIGALLAVSRSHLDTQSSMAWVLILLIILFALEYLLLEPIKRKVEKWRGSN